MVKACFRCGDSKPISDFYAHKMMADGHLNKCKECTKADVRSNRLKHVDRYRAYDRERYYENGHRSAPSPEAVKRGDRRWTARNLHKKYAHTLVQRAVRSGQLTRPEACERCGERCKPQAHHHDYTKPLDVEWVCSSCHGLEHRRYTREENQALLKSS